MKVGDFPSAMSDMMAISEKTAVVGAFFAEDCFPL